MALALNCPQVMLLLIILNVLAVIGESMSWVKEALGADFLNGFELMSVLLFTCEYLANVWSANANIRQGDTANHSQQS